MDKIRYPWRDVSMKQETVFPDYRLRVLLRVYALALLLATFISALHAGILFGLADLLTLFREWAKSAFGGRPADILSVIVVISCLFAVHIAEAGMWAAFFCKSGAWLRLVTVGILLVFLTRRSVTVMSCSQNRGGASARSQRSTDCLPSDARRPFSSWCSKSSGNARDSEGLAAGR
jgi:hypothetical protein